MFIQGIVKVCDCGREIDVEKDVLDIHPNGDTLNYWYYHGCIEGPRMVSVTREVHRQAVAWLRKLADGKRDDGLPVSDEERQIIGFRLLLEGIKTPADLERV